MTPRLPALLLSVLSALGVSVQARSVEPPPPDHDSTVRFERRMDSALRKDTALASVRKTLSTWVPQVPYPQHIDRLLERTLSWERCNRLDSAQSRLLRRHLVHLVRSQSRQDVRNRLESNRLFQDTWALLPTKATLRPTDTLLLSLQNSWRTTTSPPDTVLVELTRVDAFGPQQNLRVLVTDTVPAHRIPGNSSVWRLEQPIPGPGIWRVSALLDEVVRETFVQVTWLDAAMLRDENRVILWGSSPSDILPPPYQVHVERQAGWTTRSTDDRGAAEIRMGEFENSSMRVILEKDGHQALMNAPGLYASNDPVPYAWTDRPSYRPGDLVHVRGVLLQRAVSGELEIVHADSVRLQVSEGSQRSHSTVPMDASGQFSDTIRLSETANQGLWAITTREMVQKGRTIRLNESQQFHFLVKAYRKPEFEISARSVDPVVSVDDTASLDIEGRYLFGGNMAGAEVKVRWSRNNRHGWGEDDLFHTNETVLDAQGRVRVKISTRGLSEWETLKAEVIVTDASRREERIETAIQVWPTELQVQVETTPATYLQKGKPARITIRTVDRRLRPVSGPVKVRLSSTRELLLDTLLVSDSLGTCGITFLPTTSEALSLEVAARAASGRWSLHRAGLQVRDYAIEPDPSGLSFDRELAAPGDTLTVTVASAPPGRRLLVSAHGQTITHWEVPTAPAKGNPLTIRIPLPATLSPEARIEVVTQTDEGLRVQTKDLRLVDSSALLQVEIEARKLYFPGDTMKARLKVRDHSGRPVRGRFSVSLADDALWQVARKDPAWRAFNREPRLVNLPSQVSRGGTYSRIAQFEPYVWQLDQLLSTVSPMPAQWEPWPVRKIRKPSTLVARKGSGGKRSKARRAAKESESMDLASGKISGYLDNPQAVYILQEEAGDRMAAPAPPPGRSAGMPAPEALAQPARIRSDFRDLAFWSDSVITDSEGVFELKIPLPDDLTRWRMVLRGTDGVSRILEAEETYQTRTELMVKVEAPRALVESDSFLVGTVVHNLAAGTKSVQVELKLDGSSGRLVGPSTRRMDVPGGGVLALEWPVQVVAPGRLSFQAVARTAEQADAEARSWPVLVHGIPQTSTVAGRLDLGPSGKAARDLSVAFPDSSRPADRTLHLEASPTMAHLLFGSLDYLTGYPYGCVEQTLSRFVPNLIVSSVTRRLGMRNDSLEANIVRWDSAGIARLTELQQQDGGWGWWGQDVSDPRMTVLALEGLARAESEINTRGGPAARGQLAQIRRMRMRGDPALRIMLNRDDMEPTLRAQATRVLALNHGLLDSALVQRQLRKAWKSRAALDASGLAYLLEAAHAAGARDIATESAEMLMGVVRQDTSIRDEQDRPAIHWGGHAGWSWGGDEVEATANVVRALVRTGRSRDLVERSIAWLSQRRSNGYWNSTKTTARVIEALALALESSGDLRTRGTARVLVDGKEVARFQVDSSNIGNAKTSVDVPVSGQATRSKVRFEFEGRGRLHWSVTRSWVTAESPIAARSGELKVTRSYTRLIYEQGQDGNAIVLRRPFEGELSPGDELEVRIDLEASRAGEHLMLQDWFPQGMEVLEKPEEWISRWCGWWWRGYTHKEARDDHMVWFLSNVHPGTTTFTYLLRAERPGLYHALPARAELMYAPKVKANSAESVVRIRAK